MNISIFCKILPINISHTVNTIKAFNNIILDTIGDNFEIPVDIEEMLPEIEKNRLAMEAYFGNICDIELDSASIIMNIESVDSFVAGFEKKIPYMKVDFLRSGKRGFCYFGALEIMESMAYMIEKCFFDNVSAPSYPYHFVEYISTFIYPDVAGFIPFLADFCLTENEPKPIRITLPFRFISSIMISMTASSAFLDSVLFNPVFAATALVSSFLFILLLY